MDQLTLFDMMSSNWGSFPSSQDGQTRAILEPILEETSDDEDSTRDYWSIQSYENDCSSGSETGSVIRLGTKNPDDGDSISERDFLCPPKRRRQELFCFNDRSVSEVIAIGGDQDLPHPMITSVTKPNVQKIRLDALIDETDFHKKRYRIDDSLLDYASDSESSLSRSSSLIQFESLERQLQNEYLFSSSSPLLVANSNGDHQDFERFIPLSQQQFSTLPQTPVTVSIKTKLVTNTPFGADKAQNQGLSSFFNPIKFHLKNTEVSSTPQAAIAIGPKKVALSSEIANCQCEGRTLGGNGNRGKNSLEELSEDSGYCGEHSFGLLKNSPDSNEGSGCNCGSVKSSSEPGSLGSDSLNNRKNFNEYSSEVSDEDESEVKLFTFTGGPIGSGQNNNSGDLCKKEIYSAAVNGEERNFQNFLNINHNKNTESHFHHRHQHQIRQYQNHHPHHHLSQHHDTEQPMELSLAIPSSDAVINKDENKRFKKKKKSQFFFRKKRKFSQRSTSRSLPNIIFLNPEAAAQFSSLSAEKSICGANLVSKDKGFGGSSDGGFKESSDDFLKVTSFPEGLNFLLENSDEYENREFSVGDDDDDDEESEYESLENYFYPDCGGGGGVSVAHQTGLDLANIFQPKSAITSANGIPAQSRAGLITASYSNLTALDYSDGYNNRIVFTKMDNYSKTSTARPSRPTIANPEITLLDEISFNFDKNLSIINDRCGNFEPLIEDEDEMEQEPIVGILNIRKPPKPPPRKSHSRKINSSENLKIPSSTVPSSAGGSTTSSRESLTFDRDPTNLVTCYAASLERCNFPIMETSPTYYRASHDNIQESKPIQSSISAQDMVVSTPNLSSFQRFGSETRFNSDMPENKSRTVGILSNQSRGSLYKEVTFHPIVSEISWRQQDSLSDDSLEENNSHNEQTTDEEEDDDYFGLKKNDNFKDLHFNDEKSSSLGALPTTTQAINIVAIPQQSEQDDPTSSSSSSTKSNKQIIKITTTTRITPINGISEVIVEGEKQQQQQPRNGSESDRGLIKSSNFIVESSARNSSVEKNNSNSSGGDNKVVVQKTVDNNSVNLGGEEDNRPGKNNSNNSCSSGVNNNNSNFKMMRSQIPNTAPHVTVENNSSTIMINNNNNNNTNNVTQQMIVQDHLQQQQQQQPQKKSKKRKNSFFSRLSNFRFSLKNSKKESLKNDKNQIIAPVKQTTTPETSPIQSSINSTAPHHYTQNSSSNKCSPANNNFIYIPLKDPVDKLDHFTKQKLAIQKQQQQQQHQNQQQQMFLRAEQEATAANNGGMIGRNANTLPPNMNNCGGMQQFLQEEKVVHKKPPLPKLPPRVVGVSSKRGSPDSAQSSSPSPNAPPNQQQYNIVGLPKVNYDRNGAVVELRDGNNNDRLNSSTVSEDFRFVSHNPKRVVMRKQQPPSSQSPIGLIETNLDTHETVITGKTRSLMELHPQHQQNPNRNGPISVRQSHNGGTHPVISAPGEHHGRPHKSMEFLLDKENQLYTLPPENELQKIHETPMLSEHQLRVQASLQRLNIPDWYRQYNTPPPKAGDLKSPTTTTTTGSVGGTAAYYYRKRNLSGTGTPAGEGQHPKWSGLNSKTTSLSSLGSSQRFDKSALLLSPSSQSHHGNTGFSRWSTSHLNSTQTSPSISSSGRSSFSRGTYAQSSGHSFIHSSNNGGTNIRSSYRQPYLGWRSQEKLSHAQVPRTPAERLASSLLAQQQQKRGADGVELKSSPTRTTQDMVDNGENNEIRSSIKEVTSAIVHYVNDQTNRNSRSRSTSPNVRKCWLESSFVGIGPLESPQTPTMDTPCTQLSSSMHSQQMNDFYQFGMPSSAGSDPPVFSYNNGGGAFSETVTSRISTSERPPRPRPGSASLEDVLASLLGLPPPTSHSGTVGDRDANRSSGATASKNCLGVDSLPLRRHSEGDTTHKQSHNRDQSESSVPTSCSVSSAMPKKMHQRRISLDSSDCNAMESLKCRFPKCENRATAAEAKKTFKSCHNCNHLYCSRDCRRAHWERHRKACLHSRVSALCRQVLSACKDEQDTLKNLSLLAKRGFLSQGRGVVRILFRSPESAESFIKQGFQQLGETSYVRWPDLLPAEMGPELYSELLRLSTEYKPESKMLVYVAICVVSEAPSGRNSAPVKWERQLVSRCAKLKLCKSALSDLANFKPNFPKSDLDLLDILILTFSAGVKGLERREVVLKNMEEILQKRGVSLKKNYPEIFQKLSTFLEGTTERFVPVTLHPKDITSSRTFVCIIMPNADGSENLKLPKTDNGSTVQVIDVGQESRLSWDGAR